MPDAFVGKLLLPGLLLQFGQVVSGGIGLGMGGCRKKGEPEKQASYKTSRPHVGTMGVMGIAIWTIWKRIQAFARIRLSFF
jgi:hypothetical protein